MYDPAGKGQAHSTKYHIRIGSDGTVLTQPLTWVMGAYDSKQCKYLTGFGHSGDGRTIRIVEFAIRNHNHNLSDNSHQLIPYYQNYALFPPIPMICKRAMYQHAKGGDHNTTAPFFPSKGLS